MSKKDDVAAAMRYVLPAGAPGMRRLGEIPLTGGLEYGDLPEQAQRGLKILQQAGDDPKTKLASRALDVWGDTLSAEQKSWLMHTEVGRNEMWRRMGLAHQLCAPLKTK